jgi:2-methylcitrate dehydratase PrpD
MTVKNHGCCGHIFAALDAVRDLQREHGFAAGDVEALHVAGYAATKNVCDRPDARTEQEARFSTQFTVATMLIHGGVRLAAFAPERLSDPAIRAIMGRITVSEDGECTAAFPGARSAKVSIRLRDGRALHRHQPTRRGDPDAPLSDAELDEKFLELVSPVTGEARALLEALWRGNALPGEVALRRAEPVAAHA